MPGFLYSAHIVGLAGIITRPFEEVISAQAVSALPFSGGYSSALADFYKLGEVISHEGIRSTAGATYNPETGVPETLVMARIQAFNVANILTVESCTASMASLHPAGQETRITPLGSTLEGLRIAGRAIELESAVDLYASLDTMSALRERYRSDAWFRERFLRDAFADQQYLPENVRRYFPWMWHQRGSELPEDGGMTIVPLFTVKNPSEPGFEVFGNVISVENFGRIQLGQLMISGNWRGLTMIQVDLGSPIQGQIAICSGETGGRFMAAGGGAYLAPAIRFCERGHSSVSGGNAKCWCGRPFRR
jgi:hypothetical protein